VTVRALAAALVAVGVVSTPGVTSAQGRVGIVVAVEGAASVTRAAQGQVLSLGFSDNVMPGDRIVTQKDSLVRMFLNYKVTVTVRELSSLTIEAPGKGLVDLKDGKIGVGVAPGTLKPDEVFELHTPNSVVQVREAIVIVEYSGTTTYVDSLRGAVSALAIVGGVASPFVQVPAERALTITDRLGPLRPIRSDVESGLGTR
jgi:FecR protein